MSLVTALSPAAAADADAIAALLRAAELPSEDFAPHLAHFIVARDARGEIVGAVGAEVYGEEALLRSFVVAPALRAQGVGARLIDELDRSARRWGVKRWWLLTTTAEPYFARRGFKPHPRATAPASIAATLEFRELCPSANCLTREVLNR